MQSMGSPTVRPDWAAERKQKPQLYRARWPEGGALTLWEEAALADSLIAVEPRKIHRLCVYSSPPVFVFPLQKSSSFAVQALALAPQGRRPQSMFPADPCVCSVVSDSGTPWTVAKQTLVSMGFPRQDYWSELPLNPFVFFFAGKIADLCLGQQWHPCEPRPSSPCSEPPPKRLPQASLSLFQYQFVIHILILIQ